MSAAGESGPVDPLIPDQVERHARVRPDATAVYEFSAHSGDRPRELTWAQLDAAADRTATALLELGVTPGDAVFVRTGHGTRWFTETATFYDGAPGIGLECARWFADKQVCIVGADNFAVEVVPPVDPEVFHPCHQHLIMENGIHLQEGMTFEGLVERQAWVFAYVFAPLPIVGATGSPGNPIAVL